MIEKLVSILQLFATASILGQPPSEKTLVGEIDKTRNALEARRKN